MTQKEIIIDVLRLCETASKALNDVVNHIEQNNLNDIFLTNDEIDFSEENIEEIDQCISILYDTEKSCVRILTEKFNDC